MKRLLSLAIILLLCTTMLPGCAAAKNDKSAAAKATITREYGYIKNFSALKAAQGVNVIYTVSTGAVKVSIKATPDAIDRFEARLDSDGTLVLGAKKNAKPHKFKSNSSDAQATFYVSGPAVNKITAGSASEINVSGDYDVKGSLDITTSAAAGISFGAVTAINVEIDAASASWISIDRCCISNEIEIEAASAAGVTVKGIKANTLKIDAASSASVNATGAADNVKYEAASTAKIDAKGLKAARGSADAASCANISCDVASLRQSVASYGSVKNSR